MISKGLLKRRLSYDPETGLFRWINGGRFGRLTGLSAGYVDPDGYRQIRIDGKLYQAHRLAWLYMTGDWPEFIDHRNGIPGDDRWANLRNATKRINQENRRKPNNGNKSGFLGVSPNGARWSASIISHRIKFHLGTFDTPLEAHVAYVEAKRRLHEGCTI